MIVFFILVTIYISFRFQWRMAVAALLKVILHDLVITVGIYSLVGFQVTPDGGHRRADDHGVLALRHRRRLRQDHARTPRASARRGRMSYQDMVNLSLNQVLARSLNTSLVAVLPVLSILVVGAQVLGATTLQSFGLPLVIGIVAGAYSSIFIAAPARSGTKADRMRGAGSAQRGVAHAQGRRPDERVPRWERPHHAGIVAARPATGSPNGAGASGLGRRRFGGIGWRGDRPRGRRRPPPRARKKKKRPPPLISPSGEAGRYPRSMVTVERLAAPFRRPTTLDDLLTGVLSAYDARRASSPAEGRAVDRPGRPPRGRARTGASCARPASPTSPTPWPSPPSSPSWASTPGRWRPPSSTTRSRTPGSASSDVGAGLRRGRGRRRRRGHQARPPRVRLQGGPAGGHHPQDARGHGQRLAGAAHQAGRPPAQHADDRRDARVEAARAPPRRPSTSTRRWRTASGIQEVKWQLEDLAFATLHPKRYAEIEQMVAARAPSATTTWPACSWRCRERLAASGIAAEVTGRPKHLWSIYEKMVVRGKEFAEIHDLVGLRVIVDSEKDCWAALGSIHAIWSPVQGRFKDYINSPKFNLYQSLHTTVIGLEGKPIEVQIRTQEMHRRAEYGIAAHWGYKERARTTSPPRRRWPGCSASSTGSRRPPTPRVPRDPEARPRAGRGLRLHPQGQGDRPGRGRHAHRLRLRDPHRGRPPLHRRQGERPPRAARHPAALRRHRRDHHLQGPRPPARRATGCRSSPRPGPATRSASGSAASGARTPSSPGARS